MAKSTLTRNNLIRLDDLFERVRAIVDEEAFVPSKATEEQRKRAYWRIGQAIDSSGVMDDEQGKLIVRSLGTRLNKRYRQGFGGPTLSSALRTYQAFPSLEQLGDEQLDWKHYVELASIEDEAFRSLMIRKAKERDWGPYQLSLYANAAHDRPWEHCGYAFCDEQVVLYALAYTRTCGVVAAGQLRTIYLEDGGSADDFDFNETLYYLGRKGRSEGLPGIWKYQGETYLVDRSLADALDERVPYRSSDRYYYRDPYGPDREVEARETFLDELRIRRHQRALYDAARLAERQHVQAPKHLNPEEVRKGILDSILCSHSATRLLTQLCVSMSSDIDPLTGLTEGEETIQHALSRLTRHVSRTGVPMTEEIASDALFLLTLAGEPLASAAILKQVGDTLQDIYEELPLWTFGGYSQQDLEQGLPQATTQMTKALMVVGPSIGAAA